MATGLVARETQQQATARVRTSSRVWAALGVAAVLGLGAVEDWFGKTDSGDLFGSDAVQYLDCARAIGRGDWHAALNPLWSQGYPALLALARPLFASGMQGDWLAMRAVNFAIFCLSLLAFGFLVRGLLAGREGPRGAYWVAAGAVFVSAQVCLGQVSRVGPDALVAAFFLVACGLLVRMARGLWPRMLAGGSLFGLVLGLGFLVKAVLLPLGCGLLGVFAAAEWLRSRRLRAVLPAVLVFGGMVIGYGAALSHAVGRQTLGDSGALNYAWHVDRLSKWVHWEGGVESAAEAWPKPWISRFVRWDADPPAFGRPVHPSVIVGSAPAMYVFHEPGVSASYVPYYDPAYWYQGYRKPVRWRYQLVAVGKNMGDLAQVLLRQAMVWAVLAAFAVLWWERRRRRWRESWALLLAAGGGVLIYLPVHLEGRYLSGFLAVLGMCGLMGLLEARPVVRRVALGLVLVGLVADLLRTQHEVWHRATHGWTYKASPDWQAAATLGLPRGSQVGMISWTPNLHCDWAYLSGVQITSEIASGADERAFWAFSPVGQAGVLERFRENGAVAVLTWERPPDGAVGWLRVGQAPMWMHRF